MILKLLLQCLVSRLVLSKNYQSRCFLIQTVHHNGTDSLGMGRLIAREQTVFQCFAWDSEHSGRLVQDSKPLVIIDDIQRCCVLHGLFKWISLDIKALQHEIEDGFALAAAGRIKVTVMSHLAHG